jgi:acylphosphatase
MDIIRTHVLIAGKVQGVGYRFATAQVATRLGLTGWVQNLPDGRVEAVFEGDRATVNQMLDWCRQGPPTAIVATVAATPEIPEGLPTFQVIKPKMPKDPQHG